MTLIEEAKAKIKELEMTTGSLEALEMVQGNVAIVGTNGEFILEAVLSQDNAKDIEEYVRKMIDIEKKQYEDRLTQLMGINSIATVDKTDEADEIDLEELKSLVKQGKTLTEIGKIFGKTKKQMHDIMVANKISVKSLCP